MEVVRCRWHETGQNSHVGDLVLVHQASKVKNKYVLARVQTVKISKDGLVRSCSVGYSVTKATKDPRKYCGQWVTLNRSVQKLTLLLAVEEMEEELVVSDGGVYNTVK